MTRPLARADVERFRTAIAERLGLQFDEGKLDGLADLLRERIETVRGDSVSSYLLRLAPRGDGNRELRAIAERITVPETYFFRNPDHFRAFTEVVLPDWLRAGHRPLRILSAGCASGEEAYSLAIAVRERLPDLASRRVAIQGIDVNAAALDRAASARYSAWSLRQTPRDIQDRYFRSADGDFLLDEAIRSMVSFEERNLLDLDPVFWERDAFGAIFCRNVIMYFSLDAARAVVERMTRALTPGGFLFLGYAETLRGISHDFHLRHTHDTFYYQRRDACEPRPASPGVPARSASPEALPPAPLDSTIPWVDLIQQSSERIATLARSSGRRERMHPEAQRAASRSGTQRGLARDLGFAVELLRQERFGDAIEFLGGLPPESTADPDAQLLRAVLLANRGDLSDAEGACTRLLAADDLNAGAHYLMALCREHAGDRRASVEHDQAAVYLDQGFAMPHLHLGLLARRAGDFAGARSELERALVLLLREDASRILLFGGGFSREALVELCRAELGACRSGR